LKRWISEHPYLAGCRVGQSVTIQEGLDRIAVGLLALADILEDGQVSCGVHSCVHIMGQLLLFMHVDQRGSLAVA